MAWTAPMTWTADQLVKALEFNAQLRDNMLILKVAVDDSGKIHALTSTYFADLDGSNLTGVAKLASASVFTGLLNVNGGASARFRAPVGADKWAT